MNNNWLAHYGTKFQSARLKVIMWLAHYVTKFQSARLKVIMWLAHHVTKFQSARLKVIMWRKKMQDLPGWKSSCDQHSTWLFSHINLHIHLEGPLLLEPHKNPIRFSHCRKTPGRCSVCFNGIIMFRNAPKISNHRVIWHLFRMAGWREPPHTSAKIMKHRVENVSILSANVITPKRTMHPEHANQSPLSRSLVKPKTPIKYTRRPTRSMVPAEEAHYSTLMRW